MKSFIEKVNPASPAAVTLFRAVKKSSFKNRWLSALAALVTGLLLQAGLAAAQNPNLVTNPSFETGNTSGWTIQGSCTLSIVTSPVQSGTYACKVSGRSANYAGIAQSLLGKLTSGQTYNFSMWVRLVSSGSQAIQVTVAETIGGNTTYTQPATGTATANGWTQLSGQYTYNPSGTVSGLTFYVELPNSTVSYYVDNVSVTSTTVTPTSGECSVDWTNVDQRIDGFGASSAWWTSWTSTEADMFFGTNSGTGTSFNGTNFSFHGVGLSLLRNHIYPAGYPSTTTSPNGIPYTTETTIMQMAQALGARIWSAPWTPPAGFKANNDIYDTGTAGGSGLYGGHYLGGTANNQAYASQLANYVTNMEQTYNVNIYAISVQNEPDANVQSYEACQWTNTDIHDFVTNLYNALAARGVGSTKIIMPESQHWTDPHNLMGPTLSDPNSAADVGIIADHNYDGPNSQTGSTATPTALPTYGKALWETEVMTTDPFDGSISNAIYWAGRIHLFMTAAQANAYHYWWLFPLSENNEALTDTNGIPAKRMYALGQFSRFVRPGFYRISIDNNTGSALISAYKDPNSGGFAIVAINSSATVVTQTFNLTNVTGVSSTVTPWITSATNSLDNLSPVSVSGSSFTYALPAQSIITFVGAAGSSPSPAPTTTTLASGANPSTYGDAVTFTATVKTNGVAVGGGSISGETVTFYDGTSPLGTGSLNSSGQATYTTTANQLNAGSPSITAVYAGDSSYEASTNSPALSQAVNPATLTYTANAAGMIFGAPVPALSGSVGGFVGTDTQGNATTGTLTFTTSATSSSAAGNYAIDGSGLTANNGNYTFVQAAGNATALTISPLVTPAYAGQGITVVPGGYQLSFSAQDGQTYKVLATSDLTLPVADWTVVTNGTFGSGNVTITDNSTNMVRFYIIVSP